MMKITEIKNDKSLDAWLADQPPEFAVIITHRAALRVLPLYLVWVGKSKPAQERGLNALPILNSNLISSVALARLIPSEWVGLNTAGVAAELVADSAYDLTRTNFFDKAAVAAGGAATAAATATHSFQRVADRNIGRAVSAADYATSQYAEAGDIWASVRADCLALLRGSNLPQAPLWPDRKNPIAAVWERVTSQWSVQEEKTGSGSVTTDWSFWIKWYDDALEGREPNWEMLKEIALIEPAEWEKGPEHINNEVIARIVEKYRLLREVRDMRKELAVVRRAAIAAAPIGHNNPPEAIEAEAEAAVITQTEIIWARLGEVEEELSKPQPSPLTLKRASVAAFEALKSVLNYGAGLADIALKNAAKEGGAALGKWGVRGLIAWLALQNPQLTSVFQQLIEFAKGLLK